MNRPFCSNERKGKEKTVNTVKKSATPSHRTTHCSPIGAPFVLLMELHSPGI